MMNNATGFAFDWQGEACGTNKRYVNRTFNLTNEYRDFRDSIAETCWAMNPKVKISGWILLLIEMWIGATRDKDSLVKPIFDGIGHSPVIENDLQIGPFFVDPHIKGVGAPDRLIVKGVEIAQDARFKVVPC